MKKEITEPANENKNEGGQDCPSHRTDLPLPESAYSNGRLTLAGWLLSTTRCPRCFEKFCQGMCSGLEKTSSSISTLDV
jgi:hypothetical protein